MMMMMIASYFLFELTFATRFAFVSVLTSIIAVSIKWVTQLVFTVCTTEPFTISSVSMFFTACLSCG